MSLQHIAAGERRESRMEYLVIRGFLSADLAFRPLAAHSAFALRPTSPPDKDEYFAEIRDPQGQVLNRQPVQVFDPIVCVDYPSHLQLVDGRIALRRGAAQLLLFKGDILVDRRPIADPPTLTLAWKPKEVDRDQAYDLTLRYSKPEPDAYLRLYYQWGEGAYQPVGLLEPQEKIRLSFGGRPGGRACRLIAAYTSGLRTTVAMTEPFTVPQRQPTARIISPARKTVLAPRQPVTLRGQIDHRDGRRVESEDLIWYLEDKPIGQGTLITLPELPPGKSTLVLKWRNGDRVLDHKTLQVVRPKA